MDMRQSARLTPTAFGAPETVVAFEEPRAPSGALPLLILVAVLAAAAVWFVGLPALDRPARAERACEVIVVEYGNTKCVKDPGRGSRAAGRKAPPPAG